MPRLSLKECANLLGSSCAHDIPLNAFCVDTRLLQPGDLFFALPGERTDGHNFLEQASALGAVAAVVSSRYRGPDFGLTLIQTPDVLKALQGLAKQVIALSSSQIIAITGSVGKTTTKEFASAILKRKFRVGQTPGNSNSQIGLPLAILNHTTGDEDVLVLEMGLTVQGHIKALVEIAPPDIAIITTTALVHAQNFDSLDAIGCAKAEIFSHSKTRLGILHHGIVNMHEICQIGSCYKVSFSASSPEADYYLDDSEKGMQISGQRFSPVTICPLKLPARHNRHNFLAAAIAAKHMGMTWAEIEEAVNDLALPERRMELVEKQGVFFVNDSYNASELSVKAALESLPAPREKGKKVAVLGEMLELGKFSGQCHRSVGEHALNFVDAVVCYGEHCRPIVDVWQAAGRPAYLADTQDQLFKHVKELVGAGDVVLLKGSRSKGMWKILDEF